MNEIYMKLAFKMAEKAYKNEDIPVGAVVVKNGKILAKTYNKKNKLQDPTCHAEILAIKKACKKIKDFRLEDADIYITKEPCIMCYGALLSARVKTIYFGAYDKKYSILQLKDEIPFNHKVEIVGGVMEKECSELISNFFAKLRSDKNVNSSAKNSRKESRR